MTSTTHQSRDMRLIGSIVAAKTAGRVIRRLGRGGGTAAPGLVAERLDTGLLTKLTAQLQHGVVVVAGTNGKTTTSRMIADVFEAASWRVAHNRSGSNLVRGVVAAFIDRAAITGSIGADAGVIEADEAAMPEIVRRARPRVILLNNLFRDQLDRYGELDTIARTWKNMLATLPSETTVVVNADDPTLVDITDGITARRVCFGLNERTHVLEELPHAADAAVCRACGSELGYYALYVSHLGDWYCTGCERRRPPLDYVGSDIQLNGVTSLSMQMTHGEVTRHMEIGVPGLYNAYNALAAAAVAREMGVEWSVTERAFAEFRSAFGRIERLTYKGHELTLALVKNPTGFNEVLRMLTAGTGSLELPTMICINDLDADGRDVSWLWDVDFELLADGEGELATTGLRGADMANRLKYAGVPTDRLRLLPDDVSIALDAFVDGIPDGQAAYILPSYTAMLKLRATLVDRGAVAAFWEQ